MLKYLLQRPVAVLMTFLAVTAFGLFSYTKIPLSLMPHSDTPQLSVEVTVPDGSPMYIEQSVLNNLRSSFQGLFGIKQVSSLTTSASGHVMLTFEYGTDMKQAYIEVNEKIDQSLRFLPKDLERPVVRRVLQTDIPVVRVQVYSEDISQLELTEFSRNIVKRRLEQLIGVSLVESNGGVRKVIRVTPDREVMARYNISENQLLEAISSSNLQIAQIKVNEGIYQYDLTFENLLASPENLSQLVVYERSGRPIRLSELTNINKDIAKPLGSHWFGGKQGIVFAVHSRETADFNQLEQDITGVLNQLEQDFPFVVFAVTQNQSELLNNSIRQLTISLILGIILAALVIFLFSSDWRSSLLMFLLIPVAILICLGILYVLDFSLNIITLSGLILGVGILTDNGIILIDNIRSKATSFNLFDACIQGTTEIMPALVSSAGTTLCVFIPLVFLEGVGGALFTQQAITFGVVLGSSLLVSFYLLPLLYLKIKPASHKENRLFRSLKQHYSNSQSHTIERVFLFVFLVLILAGGIAYQRLPQTSLPTIQTNDAQVAITWGRVMALDVQEKAVRELVDSLEGVTIWESDIGKNEIYEAGLPSIDKTLVYLQFDDQRRKVLGLKQLRDRILTAYPASDVEVSRAKNPFDQLLGQKSPYAIFQLRASDNRLITKKEVDELLDETLISGLSFQVQQGYEITFDQNRLNAFGLSQNQLIEPLQVQFGDYPITTVNLVNESIPIVMRGDKQLDKASLDQIRISVKDSISYPISYFINNRAVASSRYIQADEGGIYQTLEVLEPIRNLSGVIKKVREFGREKGWQVTLKGDFRKVQENLKYLTTSFTIVLFLLFTILAAQFESLRQPIIILIEIPISLSGSLLFLTLSGHSLNLSSMMGIIIMLGIIVNDSILKVDSINRYLKSGKTRDDAIKQAGEDRLKPILMTTLTTILALLPILWSSGLGSDIQIPLCIAVIGGLFIGTICSLYLIPLLYRIITPAT